MTQIKNWINVLPINEWTSFYGPQGELEVTFRLDGCQIINGRPEYTLTLEGWPHPITGSLEALPVSKNLSIRLYMPIEFHNVPGVGLSPKMVYIFPRGSRVQEYKPNGNQARRGG